MQPLKITVPGAYWDSQIYEGRLYLFGRSGDIISLDWDSLIKSWNIDESLSLVMTCAFQRSDYLYKIASLGITRDPEFHTLLIDKFSRLTSLQLEVSSRRIRKHSVGQQDNPLPFPHTDCEIYGRRLYASSKSGVSSATCNKRTKYPVSTRPKEIWDGPVLGISALYGTIALAAGDEGLLEHKVDDRIWDPLSYDEGPRFISQAHCTDCDWAFYSIFGSSSLGPGFLASYKKEPVQGMRGRSRHLDRVIKDTELFGNGHGSAMRPYSWASRDKICQAIDGEVKVLRYTPWHREEDRQIEPLGTIKIGDCDDEIVAAAVGLFGIVLELDSGLVIILSSGVDFLLPGEPVNWRIFPRSKHYENQLHIVYDDRLEILSFNHDYLVDQQAKISGTKYYAGGASRSRLPEQAQLGVFR